VNDADEEVALAEGLGIGSRPGDFPGYAGERGGEVVLGVSGPRQADAQRALGLRWGEFGAATRVVRGDDPGTVRPQAGGTR